MTTRMRRVDSRCCCYRVSYNSNRFLLSLPAYSREYIGTDVLQGLSYTNLSESSAILLGDVRFPKYRAAGGSFIRRTACNNRVAKSRIEIIIDFVIVF
jgi:hypothetical protein